VWNLVSHVKGNTRTEYTNSALWGIFKPKNELTGGWRELHSEKTRNSYSLLTVIRMIKLRSMRWVWHVACMHIRCRLKSMKGRRQFEYLDEDGRAMKLREIECKCVNLV
jgi:hypothetical protein